MTLNTAVLQKITTPKPARKGATEERIFADKQKAHTTAALVAALASRSNSQEGRG